MRLSAVLAAALASLTYAEDSASPLTFTFQTFTDGVVKTATRTYGSGSASTPSAYSTTHASAPTSYVLNSADLAYPTFRNASSALANDAPAKGLMNTTQLIADTFALIELGKKANPTNCKMCQNIFTSLSSSMKLEQELLHDIAVPFCEALNALIPYGICVGLLNVGSNDIGGIFPAMDMQGVDGQLLCAFMFGACDLPPPPALNTTALYKGTTKPAPKILKPSGKEPLKVLHISDYHLDLRYVVGSEANCGGALCCRVFPYTNVSAPIVEPASLFGNYQCDTPEGLATSVFRAVPDVTGIPWEDFSFGIFTGDLVSHDLWELTPEYVLAEELQSYQEFFNGMEGVTMYPSLGNHDTFPHAFTSFPGETDVLPANASYRVQELYNYGNVTSAWENYGWIDAATAQAAVASGLGIYRTMTKEGLTIISLNSDVWYYFNLYAYIGGNHLDHGGLFTQLIDWLLEAEKADQAVWLIQHVNVGGSTDYEALPAPTDLYYNIVDRFNNTIRGTFFGHTHEDEFGVFYANNRTVISAEDAVAVAYIMPSVTTYQNLNAGFRYYLVDPETFAIIDSITYYANVSDTNAWSETGVVKWEFEYSARETYGYNQDLVDGAPIGPAFWHNAAANIYSNDTTFERYTDLRSKLYRPYAPVTGEDKITTLCGLTSMSVPIFEECLNSNASTTSFLRKRDSRGKGRCDHH